MILQGPTPGAAAAELPPMRPPDRELSIPGHVHYEFQILPGGEEAIAVIQVDQMSAWRTLICFWVEITALLVAVAGLLLLWRAWHWGRRPREVHCRRCRYALVGLEGADRCPECGRALGRRGRVAGRPWRRRVVAGAALLAVAGGAYPLGKDRLERYGFVSAWFDWYWTPLQRCRWVRWWVSDALGAVPPSFYRYRRDVARIDLRTGSVTRIREGGAARLLPARDGETYFVSTGVSVTRHRRSDGVQLAEFRAAGESHVDLALDEEGGTLLALCGGRRGPADRFVVWSWYLATGSPRRVLELADIQVDRLPALLPQHAQLLCTRWIGDSADASVREILIFDLNGGPSRSLSLPAVSNQARIDLTGGGRALVSPRPDPGGGVLVWDLESGRLRADVKIPPGAGEIDTVYPAIDPTGRFLIVQSAEVTLLHDLASGGWFTLSEGGARQAVETAVRDDGRIVVVARTGGRPNVLVWELDPRDGAAP